MGHGLLISLILDLDQGAQILFCLAVKGQSLMWVDVMVEECVRQLGAGPT